MPVTRPPAGGPLAPSELGRAAGRHLWSHFSAPTDLPIIERGEGCYIWDDGGHRLLDGLAGLFATQVGHGRVELAEAARDQMSRLAYFPQWGYGHPSGVELAARLAGLAPGDLNRVFFTSGGSEAVESAWKLARQYFAAIGEPARHKVVSRNLAYHGTSMGALSITGLASIKTAFEPLVPGAVKVAHTDEYRVGDDHGHDGECLYAAEEIERAILREGTGDGGRGVPRACAELRRLLRAARRVLPAGPQHLRRPRRAPGVRRSDLRLRTASDTCSAPIGSATSPT